MKGVTCTCGYRITGATEEEVMAKGAQHGKSVHGFDLNDPEVKKQMEGLRKQIKDV